jgi:hypothetical protein
VAAATHKTIKVLIRIVTLSKVERPVSSAGFCKSGELILKGPLRKSKGTTNLLTGWKGPAPGRWRALRWPGSAGTDSLVAFLGSCRLRAHYQQPDYRIPTMKNFYALKSHERPMSRLSTTVFFFGGFALLAVPSLLTLAKVGRLLGRQILG